MSAVSEIRQAAALMRTEARFPLPEAAVLAVADLLDHVADTHARFEQITTGLDYRAATVPDRLVVVVARAYLSGGQP